MANVITQILDSGVQEILDTGYAEKAPYKLEAMDFFDIFQEVDNRRNDGDTYTTNLIGRNNNMTGIVKSGSRNYEQNTPEEVERFTQSYTRLGEYASWTESDELKLQETLGRMGGNVKFGYNDLLERAQLNSPRRLIDDLYRSMDTICWFGRDNLTVIRDAYKRNQQLTAVGTPSLITQNPVGKVTTNGVFTHNQIERVPASAYYTPANAEIAINQILDIHMAMLTNCGFGINRIVLPADVAAKIKEAPQTLQMKSFQAQLKEAIPEIEIKASHTLMRYNIKHAIVFHESPNDYEKVCACRVSGYKFKDKIDVDAFERHIWGVCGGFEVRQPDGIKIITGVKG